MSLSKVSRIKKIHMFMSCIPVICTTTFSVILHMINGKFRYIGIKISYFILYILYHFQRWWCICTQTRSWKSEGLPEGEPKIYRAAKEGVTKRTIWEWRWRNSPLWPGMFVGSYRYVITRMCWKDGKSIELYMVYL